MKCLLKYKWLKVPREEIPSAKGVMISLLRLSARTAYRKGTAAYCGYLNEVTPGMWVGGIVGLKSILGIKNRKKALAVMDLLQELGYITYTLEPGTKILTYWINHWIQACSGAACEDGSVYTMPEYGFLCMPRNITERLVEMGYRFEEGDAWLDLWCHTVYRDYGNAFSFLAPAIQYGKYGSVLTLEALGQRWGWEKTKVWRFFQKFSHYFPLHRLPGSYGCVVFNQFYPVQESFDLPSQADVVSIFQAILTTVDCTHKKESRNLRFNRFVAWRSRRLIQKLEEKYLQEKAGKSSEISNGSGSGIALLTPNIRAYFSHGRNCKNSRNCIYACQGKYIGDPESLENTGLEEPESLEVIDLGQPEYSDFFNLGELRPIWETFIFPLNTS